MIGSTDLFKQNKKIFFVLLGIFIIVCTVFFSLGYLFSQKSFPVLDQEKTVAAIKNCNQQQTVLNDELNRCIADSGLIINQATEFYSFDRVGIISPLLTSQNKMETTQFDYKKQLILSHNFEFNTSEITVWEGMPQNFVLEMPLPKNQEIINYFPIFISYENYDLRPTFVSNLVKDWSQKDTFTNNEGITFYFWYEFGSRNIHSVQLQTYWPYSPMGNPIFLQIKIPLENTFVEGVNDASILEAKTQAIELAKSISFKSK